ncbi:MAG: twin-arginine translocase TatA/TatE family subunit [Caldilineaceae bacterium]
MEFLPGPMELVLILIIVAMLFGVGRLPEVFGAVGKGIREFRREMAPAPEPATPPVALEVNKPVETTQANHQPNQLTNQEE